jgi:hypothetical protein
MGAARQVRCEGIFIAVHLALAIKARFIRLNRRAVSAQASCDRAEDLVLVGDDCVGDENNFLPCRGETG